MNIKEYFYHPTVCPLPWSGFILEPNGNIRNCSISADVLGNIFTGESIEDILYGAKNLKVKEDMLNEIETPPCRDCWGRESKSSKVLSGSNRDYFKRQINPNKVIEIVEDPKAFKLRQVDVRWRNSCNLACVYCDSVFSSTWAKEMKEVIKPPNEIYIDRVKKFVFDRVKDLDNVYLCGGEPLIMKENLELLNLLEKENKDVSIRVNTNLTNIRSGIYEKLLTFKNVHWIISVESIGEYFEFIRYGAKWSEWEKNLKQLKQESKERGQRITFNMTWGAICSYQIFDAVDHFCNNLGFHPNSFFVNLLIDPKELDVNALKLENRLQVADILTDRINTLKDDSWLLTCYKTMLNHINKTSDDNLISEFKKYIETIDNRRHTKGLELYQDLL